jgi:hypothetical protein
MTWGSFPDSDDFQIDLENGNQYFEKRNGFLLDFRRHHLLRYFVSESDLMIPGEIEQIRERCFSSCKTVRMVRFGSMSQLSAIDAAAFASCASLITINIPSTVTFLGQACFAYCPSLRTVSFCPGSLLECIPIQAFAVCRVLESVVLPRSVKILEVSCFRRCAKLVRPPWLLDSELVRIGKSAFSGCSSLRSMVFPSSVEYVGTSCFVDCHALRRLVFSSPSNLRELLHLPPKLSGFVSIPDSVEVVTVSPLW